MLARSGSNKEKRHNENMQNMLDSFFAQNDRTGKLRPGKGRIRNSGGLYSSIFLLVK